MSTPTWKKRIHHVIATREGLVGHLTAVELKIAPNDVFVALPHRSALWHTVAIAWGDYVVLAPVLDIGPWFTDNPYWRKAPYRPRAEGLRGQKVRDYTCNGAGIDLSDGLIRLLGREPTEWRNPRVLWWFM